MRIAFISADATPLPRADGEPGAARGRAIAALARELAAAGHAVDVFTRRTDLWSSRLIELAPGANVVNIAAGPPYFVSPARLVPHMEDFAARFVAACSGGAHYDIVHASFYLSGIAAVRAKERAGVPFVAALHELDGQRKLGAAACALGTRRAQIERRLAATADRLVALDWRERDRLVAACGADPSRIEVVPAGVDTAAFAPGSRAARGRFGLCSRDFVVVQCVRLEPGGGVDTALAAVARLKRDHGVSARLLVAADTDDLDPRLAMEIGKMRSFAALAGVAPQVTFIDGGSPSAMRDAYAAADAVVATPSDAACAPAPLEAMACGVPVIGSDIGALRDSIQDDVTGFLVPPGDAPAVAERLARFHDNPELARAYGRAAIRSVRASRTWKHTALRLARLYAAVLQPYGGRLAAAASR